MTSKVKLSVNVNTTKLTRKRPTTPKNVVNIRG